MAWLYLLYAEDNSTGGGKEGCNLKAALPFFSKACKEIRVENIQLPVQF